MAKTARRSKPTAGKKATPPPALAVPLEKARAFWHRRQGLAAPGRGAIEDVIDATGWPRTLGGVEVYLAVRARIPSLRRKDLDAAKEASRVQVIPAVRGCIYVVPRKDVPLMLRVAEDQARPRIDRDLERAAVKQSEVDALAGQVHALLKKGPLSTDGIRKALPEGAIRSLGELGKKIGLSSPLPPALRQLEFDGKVERTVEGGRLDTERYLWRVPEKNPFTGAKVPSSAAERHAAVARIYFRQAGPATLKDFATWAALSQTEARAAMGGTPLLPVLVDGYGEAFILEEDLKPLKDAGPAPATVSLLPLEDNYTVWHTPAPLTAPQLHGREVETWGYMKDSTMGTARHMFMRPVLIGDQIGGVWELDPSAGKVVTFTFDGVGAVQRKALDALADGTAAFIQEDLGHARSFSLDTMEEVQARADRVKRMRR